MTPKPKASSDGDVFNRELNDLKFKTLTETVTTGISRLETALREAVMSFNRDQADREGRYKEEFKEIKDRLTALESQAQNRKPTLDVSNGSKMYYIVLIIALLVAFVAVGGKLSDVGSLLK